MKKLFVAAGLSAFTSACYAHHHGHHPDPAPAMCALATCIGLSAAGAPPEVAVAGAVLAGVVVEHADHRHGHHCGCPTRWHNGYRLYYFGGGWEYYDDRDDCWRRIHDNHGPSW